MSDIASALSTAIAKDGQTTVTANLPMAGYRHTGVGNPTARTQYASVAGVQDGTYSILSSVSGTNTITATGPLGVAAYATGQRFYFVVAATNTAAVTININSIGAKAITRTGTAALVGGDLVVGAVAEIVYDGTRFQLANSRVGFVSVTDFGAAGDGVTDDTTAFQTAAALVGSGVVLVPPGSAGYLLSSAVSYSCSFLFLPGAYCTQATGGYITGPIVDLADRDYECMMGMGYFNIWLEGTTFSSPATDTYVATLWQAQYDGTSGTFTVDQAGGPLTTGAYNGIRWRQTVAGSGSAYRQLEMRVEDATTYNNGKATLSFLVQCETGTVACTAKVTQFFGTGGSPSSDVVALSQAFTATTSWQRFSFTFDMGSTASKTFGSNIDDCLKVAIQFPATDTFNVALQEVKLERGAIRTPFSAVPLAVQHAYVERYIQFLGVSLGFTAGAADEYVYDAVPFKTEMRKIPDTSWADLSGASVSNLHASLSSRPALTYIEKYCATAYIRSAAAGACTAIGQQLTLDARL